MLKIILSKTQNQGLFLIDEKKEMFSSTTKTNRCTTIKSNCSIVEDSTQFHSTKILYPNSSIRGVLGSDSLLQSTSTKLPSVNNHEVILYEDYIVEYSLEYGFLHLSPSARNRSGIPVMLVVLEPTQNKCFGNSVKQFLLEYFLGYDNLLISSIKSLADNKQNKGFLRNVISGKNKMFVSNEKDQTSYIEAFLMMIILTVGYTIVMKYFQYQTLVFLVNFLHQLHFHNSVSFRVLQLFIAVLAQSSMWTLMWVFFKHVSTLTYTVIIIWVADGFDIICCRSPITKKHWLKFFYLYYFSFYAYHHRFNGENSNLALLSSWLFIQHSMVYFYHHYELPLLLLRTQLVIAQIEQEHQQQQEQLQPTGGDSLHPEGGSPTNVTVHEDGSSFQPDERTA